MKKVFIGILLVGMTAPAFSAQEKSVREHTKMLQKGKYGRAALKGAAIGLPIGGAIGVSQAPYKQSSGSEAAELAGAFANIIGGAYGGLTGAVTGAAGGAALAIAYRFGLRNWQLRKINGAIDKYTLLSKFEALPAEQAMLFVAAYKRNVPVMQNLIERQPEFVNQKGVWKALTNVFYNQKPTSTQVERLQSMLKKA